MDVCFIHNERAQHSQAAQTQVARDAFAGPTGRFRWRLSPPSGQAQARSIESRSHQDSSGFVACYRARFAQVIDDTHWGADLVRSAFPGLAATSDIQMMIHMALDMEEALRSVEDAIDKNLRVYYDESTRIFKVRTGAAQMPAPKSRGRRQARPPPLPQGPPPADLSMRDGGEETQGTVDAGRASAGAMAPGAPLLCGSMWPAGAAMSQEAPAPPPQATMIFKAKPKSRATQVGVIFLDMQHTVAAAQPQALSRLLRSVADLIDQPPKPATAVRLTTTGD